jgi:hypothetical protein
MGGTASTVIHDVKPSHPDWAGTLEIACVDAQDSVRQLRQLIDAAPASGGTLAARGRSPVGRVASAAGARTRRSDASDAGHRLGDATKSPPGAGATLWAAPL